MTLSRRTLLALPLLAAISRCESSRSAQTAPPEAATIPMFRGNPARTGEHPGPGPSGEPTGLWQVRLGKVVTSSPAVVGGVIYVGSVSPGTVAGGALHAIDDTGIELWRLSTGPGDGIFSSPAVGNGVVVTGSYDGIVVAATADTGEERWRFMADSAFYGSAALVDGTVFLGSTGGHLYALGVTDGEERWRFIAGEGFERGLSSPAVHDGVVYCVSASHRPWESSFLHAIDATTGEERWRFAPTDGTVLRATPVVAAGTVHVATRGTMILAIDTVEGRVRDRFNLGTDTRTELAVVHGVAYVGTADGELVAHDVESGRPRWSRRLTGRGLSSAPAVAGGVVYVGDADGTIYAVDALSGNQHWHAGVGSLRSSPSVIGGVVYVGSNDGALRAIGSSGDRAPRPS